MAIRTQNESYIQTIMQKGLLNEMSERFALHRYSVLKARIMKYYQDLEDTGCVNIPDFLRDDTPEKLADRELKRLVMNPDGLKEFDRLYELAYTELANRGELE